MSQLIVHRATLRLVISNNTVNWDTIGYWPIVSQLIAHRATLRLVISKAKPLERNVSPVYLSIVLYMFRGRINGDTTHRSLRL